MPDYCFWVVDFLVVVTTMCQVYKEWLRNGLEKDRREKLKEKYGQPVQEGWPMESYNAGIYVIMQFIDSK